MVMADSETASAIAIRHSAPAMRTGTPRTTARSVLTELSSSGRYSATTMPTAARLNAAITGIRELSIVKIDPNRIATGAPVVEVYVVSQKRNRAASPSPAPRTMPIARSRPRGRRTPIMSMIPAATTLPPAKPHSGLIPMRTEAEPPVTLMSPSACPAYDCPRITVNVPTMPDTRATTPPASSAT